jgi:hypothetical protein
MSDPTRGDYWILRNSWGSAWGVSGYMYFAAGRNLCDIGTRGAAIANAAPWGPGPPPPPPPASCDALSKGHSICQCATGCGSTTMPCACAKGTDCGAPFTGCTCCDYNPCSAFSSSLPVVCTCASGCGLGKNASSPCACPKGTVCDKGFSGCSCCDKTADDAGAARGDLGAFERLMRGSGGADGAGAREKGGGGHESSSTSEQ